MAYEHFSFDVGESLEKQKKAKEQLEEQKKAEESLERGEAEKNEKEQAEKAEQIREKQEAHKRALPVSTRIQEFLTKYHKFLIIALVLVLIFVNVYIRVFALSAPGIDELIQLSYEKTIKENIVQKVTQEHVGPVDPALMQKEVEKQFKQAQENPKTKTALQKLQNKHKQEYFDAQGSMYLVNSDPFLYLRYARNILKRGSIGEKTENDVQFDDLRNAPHGTNTMFNLMPYYEVCLYKIMHLFDSKTQLEGAALYIPILFSTLSVVLVFLIVKRLSNAYGGFVGGLLFAIHPLVLSNTNTPDTQVPSVFFTLLTVWLVIELTFAKKLSTRFWALLVSLLITLVLYKYTWTGYYYIYAMIASYAVFYLVFVFIRNRLRKENISKKYLFGLLACIVAAICYFAIRPAIIEHILSRLNIGERAEFFPTAFFMVTELQRTEVLLLIQKMGGYLLFTAAALTLIYLIYSAFKNKLEGNAKQNLFIAYWFLGLFIVAVLAQRFTMYFSIPFAISIGVGAGVLYPCFGKMIDALGLREYKRYIKPAIAIFLILFMVFLLKDPLSKKIYSIPTNVDDALYAVSMDMKSNSKSDAIINTWWDDGYLLEYYAERPVLFDGGSFNSPALYWLSKAFVSTNANYSINTLRMLDCGASIAFDEISAKKGGPEAIGILNKILESGKEKSKEIIKKEKLDASLLDKIFCKQPEALFMASERMAKIFHQYETIAGWDFKANEAKSKIKGLDTKEAVAFLEKEYTISTEDAYELYGRAYPDNTAIQPKLEILDLPCTLMQDSIVCKGLVLDLKANAAKDAKGQIFSYYYVTEFNGTNVTANLSIDSELTLIFYQEQDVIKVAAVESSIRDSFLVKTYFLNAYDVPQLEMISHRSSLIGNKIKAYKINWVS